MPPAVLQFNSMLTGGGTDDQCAKLSLGLLRLGARVQAAGPGGREFSRRIRDSGVPFIPLPSGKPALILGLARLLRRERPDILHAHHGRDYWPALLAARLSGARPKVVLTRHLAKSPSSWPSRHFLLNQSDAWIAVSEFVARVLREGVYEPDSPTEERRCRRPVRGDFSRIHVIHGGIDTDRFRPMDASSQRAAWGLGPEEFAFGVAGGYDLPRGKGQREFLQAAARVHRQIPRARFLIIGRGSLREQLEADIVELGLQGKAILTPWSADMPATMNALDCLVHPQVGTEAFGLVLIEAFACGRPVIASDMDGVPEAFHAGGQGRLVPMESVEGLAGAMADLAVRPRLTEAARHALHERVAAKFSLGVMSAGVLSLYEALARAGSRR